MIYVHAIGLHNSMPSGKVSDLKPELKALSGKNHRRIDRFIELAIIGAHKAVAGYELEPATALYLVSGQGDIPVFERVRRQRYFQKMMSKPVDFVNLASNTAGFYVASHLKIAGANLFLSHKHFPVQMALLLAQSELVLKTYPAILLGGVDECLENRELARKLLGVAAATELGEGSNWLLLNCEPDGALAALRVAGQQFDRAQVEAEIRKLEPGICLAFSRRLPARLGSQLKAVREDLHCFASDPARGGYYETRSLYDINHFLLARKRVSRKLLHIDCDLECRRFMITQLSDCQSTQ